MNNSILGTVFLFFFFFVSSFHFVVVVFVVKIDEEDLLVLKVVITLHTVYLYQIIKTLLDSEYSIPTYLYYKSEHFSQTETKESSYLLNPEFVR